MSKKYLKFKKKLILSATKKLIFEKNYANKNNQERVIGKILSCPGYKDELWYISPLDKKRKLITITTAPIFFKKIFITISEEDLAKIPKIDEMENNKNITFRKKLKGKFIVIKNNKSLTWYIDDSLRRTEVSLFNLLDLLAVYAISVNRDKLMLIPI